MRSLYVAVSLKVSEMAEVLSSSLLLVIYLSRKHCTDYFLIDCTAYLSKIGARMHLLLLLLKANAFRPLDRQLLKHCCHKIIIIATT